MKFYRLSLVVLTLALALFLSAAFSATPLAPANPPQEVLTVWGWDNFLPDAFAEY